MGCGLAGAMLFVAGMQLLLLVSKFTLLVDLIHRMRPHVQIIVHIVAWTDQQRPVILRMEQGLRFSCRMFTVSATCCH